MKNLYFLLAILLLFSSCKEEVEVVNIRVNHFKQIGFGEGVHLIYQVQEGDRFGTEDWQNFHSEIVGFDYEWGYVYELKVEKRPVENPPQDASSIDYQLREVVSKTPVDEGMTFNLLLKSTMQGVQDLEQLTSDSTYYFAYDVNIACETLCDELANAFDSENEVSGVFRHIDGETIELTELLMD